MFKFEVKILKFETLPFCIGLILMFLFTTNTTITTITITITNNNTMINLEELHYNLDEQREINLYGLELIDSFSSLIVSNNRGWNSIEHCLAIITNIQEKIESSTNKGFLPCHDISKFPVISEMLTCFLLDSTDLEFVCGKSMESYKWLYNLILLNLYIISIETIKTNMNTRKVDELTDLKVKERELYSLLDPSIRHLIQQRGISIRQNTYIGFDTEFSLKSKDHNTLVSSQLAVTTKTYLQFPRINSYKLSKMEDGKIIALNTKSSVFNYQKIEASIKMCIDIIRNIKYSKFDIKMYNTIERFKMYKGISYTEQEDKIIFSLPRTIIQPYIHYGSSFSLKEMLEISSGLAKTHHDKAYSILIQLIMEVQEDQEEKTKLLTESSILELQSSFEKTLPLIESEKIKGEIDEKRLSRKYSAEKVSISRLRNYYLIAHLTPADLSMLSDFDIIKEGLSIVNGSFVTLGKPLKYCGRNLHIRDTMLLAPAGSKRLAAVAQLYGGVFDKIEINKRDLEDMGGFLARDKTKFTEYAMRDALISLIHASWMEDFNFQIGGVGIPLSLSSLGRSYVKSIWKEDSYSGYQISSKYLLGDVASSITPKGLNVIKDIGFILSSYTANYKGGRNECFMFGVDRNTEWFDYDLSNAYTTVLSMAGHPDYASCRRITEENLKEMSKEEILYSYTIIHATFEFPLETKYPSIPCYIDDTCTVYPLTGSCVITGAEYLLAVTQKCKLKISDIFYTPFQKSEFKEYKPFNKIIQIIQEKRREHPKGTISNLLYKEIGNSIYGSIVRGIGNKRKFDIKSQGVIRMIGDDLTNPLIGSWTTAYIRSIIGECLHSIQELNGLVVSVTTDGFITNIKSLESKMPNYLFQEFRKIRSWLADDQIGLELKSSGLGIVAWSTRGQLGIESQIIATTGLQHRAFRGKDEMLKQFIETVKTEIKTLGFVQSRLRSATEIYKKGGQVTMVRRDQIFRMHFDNRRLLDWETTIPSTIEKFIDSKPLLDISQGQNLRFIGRLSKNKQYGKYTSIKTVTNYKSQEEVVIRNFLKCLLSSPPLFNLYYDFANYQEILEYIHSYNPQLKLTSDDIAILKYRTKTVQWLHIERTKTGDDFIEYVKIKYPNFDVGGFYGYLQ